MDRSNPNSPNLPSLSKSGSSSAPFAYQTKLLERTSSRGGVGSLSRNNSQSSILSIPTGSSGSSTTARKWTPSHRVGHSLESVRDKWEDRIREGAHEEEKTGLTTDSTSLYESGNSSPTGFYSTVNLSQSSVHDFSSSSKPLATNLQRTPTYLKRRTLPAPIIASPLSPNTTGITVEAGISSLRSDTGVLRSIHLPTPAHSSVHSSSSSPIAERPGLALSPSLSTRGLAPSRYRRSHTLDSIDPTPSRDLKTTHRSSNVIPRPHSDLSASTSTPPAIQVRTTSVHEIHDRNSPSPNKGNHRTGSVGPERPSAAPFSSVPSPSPTSAMSPSPYRSSYMSSKKSSSYGEHLTSGRKLGKHLPRIASGDGNEDWAEKKENVKPSYLETQRKPLRDPDINIDISQEILKNQELAISGNVDDVAGIPGRLRLKAPNAPPSPSPSARLARGLWADTQRHLLQAYEYLCHVGEAQQWIEGCLEEELGFGVVEMEDGLRNGVVLAKLVRAFQGESIVRKIYEAPKLDFRHSDNINHFFEFVREVGLPEGFIFELTDLYEKKNLPKVIYCIHALSHLLARRGMAERIGNLLGHLQFSDDQLQRTQKGLKDAGVAMPNFGNVGRELAKEINEEPEIEVETDDERRDRLLLECQDSIIAVQAFSRGFLLRKANSTLHSRLHLTERHIPKSQALFRGVLVRRRLGIQRQAQNRLVPWVVSLQAIARSINVRHQWHSYLNRIKSSVNYFIMVQAQARGVIQRRRFSRLKGALRITSFSVIRVQSIARARIVQNSHTELAKSFSRPDIKHAIIGLQAHGRGALAKIRATRQSRLLTRSASTFISLQAHCRGVLTRRRMHTQMAKLEDISHVVIRIQAAVRTYLARKRLLLLIRGLRKATSRVVGFQARARASLVRQQHHDINKALTEVQTIFSVGGFQALARATLVRNQHHEMRRQLEFTEPDITNVQAAIRGALVRNEYRAWRDHLRKSHPVASILQALLRGALQRRSFRDKMQYYRANLSKVVKIQSLYRAKEMREQYRQLTLGKNVTVGTIKNFVHLLDDSEADFQEEIKVERLRKKVVENIRENQSLESDVNDLDVKIALVVQNVKSFEEVIKARRKNGVESAAAHAARLSLLAAHGDPFSGPNTLDHTARRKLELYQQLFYLLQTRGEYLSRLFLRLSTDNTPEKNKRFTERVVLTLFGYGQDRREDYLLLKMFQHAIRDEIDTAPTIDAIAESHPMYINIAVHYVRPKQITYARDAFQAIIREIIDSDDLDLEADPSVIHRARIDVEEMRSGIPSTEQKDVSFRDALKHPDTRAIYIRHLQVLQWWTEAFVTAITQSTKKMPYGMRYLARETLLFLREKFPDASEESYAACVGRLVYYRYINPAIITPETFDIVSKTVDVAARKNLGQISKILTQVTSGLEFDDDNPSHVPINDYVRKAIAQMTAWLIEVADVPDAESQFHAHEFLDATVQPKPIYISPNEIYAIHGLLSQHQDFLASDKDDTLRVILIELDGVPNLGNEELKDARDTAITLELTNRFAHVRDPHAEEKTLWVQAKRGVLAILRVQPAQDLLESLMRPVTDDDELVWEEILETEMESEQIRQFPRRQPSAAAVESAYRLEDIRSLKFAAVKALAISNLLELEKQGKISRDDGFQGMLNAIAGDVRSKHRKRLQRQQEMESMNDALRHLAERKQYFEEQINSYHNYVETAMNTMQRGKGKKRFVLPFTKQYFHLRDLQKSGETPQFGSFLYTAKYLYEKGILLSIDQYSPRQFDKIQLTMSSNTAGIFTLLLESTMLGVTTRIATEDIRMEDLLQAKYEKRPSLSLFMGKVKVNFELFLYQINKKFYV